MKSPLFAVLFVIILLVVGGAAQAEEGYSFGVFPYLPPSKLQELFIPIANDLSATLGKRVQISSKTDYQEFRKGLSEEQYDIAFVQPFDYVDAHDRHNYKPLAKRGEDLRAIIIVRNQSELQSLVDLKGRVVANPPKIAAVSNLTSMAFLDIGLDPEQDVQRLYSSSHFSCMQNVLIGAADACGTAGQALAHFEEKQMTQRFRILHKTKPVAHSLFVVHERVPEKERELIRQTILSWPDTAAGQKILENGHFIPFVPASDSDYDNVRNFWKGQEKK